MSLAAQEQTQFSSLGRFFTEALADTDPDLFHSIGRELTRQQKQIELIASENIVSRAVLEAQGSILTNKYAEGYPGRRYYGGCERWTSSSSSRSIGHAAFSALSMQMCSPTQAPMRISQCCLRFWSRVTGSWGSTSPVAVTSPMDPR